MPVRKSVTISLGPELLAAAEGLLATGRFGAISDVVRASLRTLEERELDFRVYRDSKKPRPSSRTGT